MINKNISNFKTIFAASALGLVMVTAACSPRAEKNGDIATKEQSATTKAEATDIRIFTMDCGTVDFSDLGLFSSGEYAGRQQLMAVPCYLIRHPKGDMVWDAGLPDSISALPDGLPILDGLAVAKVSVTMKSQFEALGLTAKDVEFFALSHGHFDHVGNVDQFTESTFLIREAEHDFMYGGAGVEAGVVDPQLVEPLRNAETIKFEGDYDVFGDGSVVIFPTPGHSPGHSGLLVKLKNEGAVMFSGDLFHLAESRERRIVPMINPDRDLTLASMDSFNARAETEGAKVIIQHDIKEFRDLPKIPDYLD